METIKGSIKISESSLQVSSRGSLTGIIFFNFDNFSFPEAGWNDRAGILLGWWILSLIDILGKTKKHTVLRFMDGPFWVELEHINETLFKLWCVDGRSERIDYEVIICANSLLDSALIASNQLKSYCAKNGLHSEDIDELVSAIRSANIFTGKN